MLAGQALTRVIDRHRGGRLVDVGCGEGRHAARFREAGFEVTTVDADPRKQADCALPLTALPAERPGWAGRFDVVWCSHVLEHQLNVGLAVQALFRLCAPEGVVAITVPPMKPELAGGHYALFTPGHLAYALAASGWSTRRGWIRQYGYNISVIAPRVPVPEDVLSRLRHGGGDLELLAPFMPWADGIPVAQYTDGWRVGKGDG